PMSELSDESGKVSVEGSIFDVDLRETRNGKYIFILSLTDYTGSIVAKAFSDKKQGRPLINALKVGNSVRVKGECVFDNFQKEVVIMIDSIIKAPKSERMDCAKEKRVELHLHTNL